MTHKLLEGIAQIFGVLTLRYFIIAGIPFVACYYWLNQKLSSSKIQKKKAGHADFGREILHSVQSTAVFAIAAGLILLTPFRQHTLVYVHLNDYPLWWLGVSLVLSLIVHDTYFYWTHRLMHHKKIFKYAHLLHHKSTNPSPWTSYAFHILEAVVEIGILLVIVMIMPLHPITIMLFTVVGFMINVYGHLGYEVMPKRFRNSIWFEVLNTSVHHNVHHSKFKGNYGLYFRVWDRLMGTEHPDYVKEYDRVQASRFGEEVPAAPLRQPSTSPHKKMLNRTKYKAA